MTLAELLQTLVTIKSELKNALASKFPEGTVGDDMRTYASLILSLNS